jgi:hypothetical protein
MEAQKPYSSVIEVRVEQTDIDDHHNQHAISHIEPHRVFVASNAEHECGYNGSVNEWHYFFDPFLTAFLPPLRGLDLRF